MRFTSERCGEIAEFAAAAQLLADYLFRPR